VRTKDEKHSEKRVKQGLEIVKREAIKAGGTNNNMEGFG